jgi:hypothetical protein
MASASTASTDAVPLRPNRLPRIDVDTNPLQMKLFEPKSDDRQ